MSTHSPIRLPVLRPLALVASLLLGACAQLPELAAGPQIKPAEAWASSQSLAAPVQDWPLEAWWQSYGDKQLNSLILEAVDGAPDMRVAQARLRRAEAAVQSSAAANGPQITGNLSATEEKQSYNYLTPRSSLPQGWNDYGRATVDLSWELDFWGRNRAALAAASSEREAQRAEAAQTRLVLGASISAAYAELARQFAAHDTTVAALEVRSKTAQLMRERFDNGMETMGAVRQAEARQAAARGDVLALEEQIALQRNKLAALMGAGPDRGLSIRRPSIELTRTPGLPPQLALDLLGRRPDVVAARLRAEAASSRIDSAKAEFYPNVNLSAFIGVQSLGLDKLSRSGSDIGSVGPAISLPIFSSGRLQANYRSRNADYDEAVANYDATVTQALHDVADATTSQRALGAQLDSANQAVEAARQAWQIARNRYEGGLSTYLDVLSAEDSLLSNLRSLTDMQSRAFSLDVALIRALGGGYRQS
jgi:NodT family efflux transporter outer membrane factor (OMF) lipoprotein